MSSSELRQLPRWGQLLLLVLVAALCWRLTAPTPYPDNRVGVMDAIDPDGYLTLFVFLVAASVLVYGWPRAEIVVGVTVAVISLTRNVQHELTTAQDLSRVAQQPGLLHLLGLVGGSALALLGWRGLRRQRRQRRSILFLGEILPRSSAPAPSTPLDGALLEQPPGHERSEIERSMAALGEGEPARRAEAARAIAEMGPAAAGALPELVRALRDPDPGVREAVVSALERVVSALPAEAPGAARRPVAR